MVTRRVSEDEPDTSSLTRRVSKHNGYASHSYANRFVLLLYRERELAKSLLGDGLCVFDAKPPCPLNDLSRFLTSSNIDRPIPEFIHDPV